MSSSPTSKPWTAPALPLPRWHACPRRRPCPAGLDAPGRRSVPCWPGRPRRHLAGAYTKAAPPTRGLVASANSTAWTQPPLFLDVTPTCSVRGHLWHEAPPSPHQSPRAYTKSSTKILNRSLNNSQRRQAVPKVNLYVEYFFNWVYIGFQISCCFRTVVHQILSNASLPRILPLH
jgi:hypothetical protein